MTQNASPASVTLILCTKNGGERLATCLDHIDRLDAPDGLQVLLVDNGSTDDFSYDLLQSFRSRTRFNCEVMQTFARGNSAGRNVALRRATGDLVVFLDDDCYADPDLVTAWVTVFSMFAELGFASGMIRRHSPEQSRLGCTEKKGVHWIYAGRFVPNGFIQGSNMAFRRQCIIDAGYFDERFGAGTDFAGEEWDLALRISLKGWSGCYFPTPKVSHDHRRDDKAARERNRFYAIGAGAVLAKALRDRHGLGTVRSIHKVLRQIRRFGWDIGLQSALMTGFLRMVFQPGKRSEP
jgi:GT2 family glycosyltransferase